MAMPAAAGGLPYCIKGCDFGGGSGDCSFSSLAQCQATASGRVATCATNPYFNAKAELWPSRQGHTACHEGDSDAYCRLWPLWRWAPSRSPHRHRPRPTVSSYPVCLHVYGPGHLLRVQLHLAASMQRVGFGPLRAMRDQSLFCERAEDRPMRRRHRGVYRISVR